MKNKKIIPIIIICLMIILVFLGCMLVINQNQTPIKMFKTVVDKTINLADTVVYDSEFDAVSGDIGVKISGDSFDEMLEDVENSDEIKETINNAKISYKLIESDENNGYLNIGLKTDKYNLLDASALTNIEEKVVYFNLGKEIYDKAIKVELDEDYEIPEVNETFKSDESKKIALDIISNEIKAMLKEEKIASDKVDGYNVDTYKTTFNSISQSVNESISKLQEDKEFLDCFEDSENVEKVMNKIKLLTDEDEISEKDDIDIEFSLYSKGLLIKKVEKISILVNNDGEKYEMIISGINTDTLKISINTEDYDANYIINKIEKNSYNTVYTMSDNDGVTLELTINAKFENSVEIPEFDTKNYVEIDEMLNDTSILIEIVENIKKTDIMDFMEDIFGITSDDLDLITSLYLMEDSSNSTEITQEIAY